MPQKPDTGGAISPSEPDALKGACPVREEVVGDVPKGNALATYFIKVVDKAPTGRSRRLIVTEHGMRLSRATSRETECP